MVKLIILAEIAQKLSFLPKNDVYTQISSMELAEATFCQFSETMVGQGLSKGSKCLQAYCTSP